MKDGKPHIHLNNKIQKGTMRPLIFFFIVFFIYVNASDDCPFECDHGTCDNGSCYCTWFWQGEKCDVPWKVNKGWEAFWFCYIAYTVILNLILFVIEMYEMKRVGSFQKNMVTIVLICLSVASFSMFYPRNASFSNYFS